VLLVVAAGVGHTWNTRPGDATLDVTLPASTGEMIRLADFRGRQPVLLVVYMVGRCHICTWQLVKLQGRLEELTAEGAAVFAVSIDPPEQARTVAEALHLTFPILSDPRLELIRPYGMKGQGMEMAEPGYVVIDRKGQILAQRVDREFGDHVELLVHRLRQAKS